MSLFLCCERSFWHCTTILVGKWTMRTAESVMLTCWPLAAGAEGVNAQVLFADVDLDFVVNLRADEDAGERGVAALGLVEGRDAHQAVDAALRLQQPVGVFALDGDGGGLDAR